MQTLENKSAASALINDLHQAFTAFRDANDERLA